MCVGDRAGCHIGGDIGEGDVVLSHSLRQEVSVYGLYYRK